ncbi:MAG: hypothetical protein E8D45_06950 [Nitrospira sp.]|nr:MAG: hypothetical protein E8D45_06950 [Nitrospira sp.]
MSQGSNGRRRWVIGTLAAVIACGGYAGTAWADNGWNGDASNFGESKGVNQAMEQYDQMERNQAAREGQSREANQAGSTDIRASRLDRNRDGVVDVNEKQVSRDRVIQIDQNQSGQAQAGDRHGVGHSNPRRHK